MRRMINERQIEQVQNSLQKLKKSDITLEYNEHYKTLAISVPYGYLLNSFSIENNEEGTNIAFRFDPSTGEYISESDIEVKVINGGGPTDACQIKSIAEPEDDLSGYTSVFEVTYIFGLTD